MIKSILIKRIATFDNDGTIIDNLKRVNFIYGANGCGKTTISNYLYDTEESKFEHCLLSWENEPVKTLVYNKEFRKRNFGNGKLGGVFTLGEATADQIQIIEDKGIILKELKIERLKKNETLEKLSDRKDEITSIFKEFCWNNIYKKYETTFKDAFVGSSKKETFKAKILLDNKNNTSDLKQIDYLKDKSKTVFGERPLNLSLINSIDYSRIIEIEKSDIWQKVIIGKADVDISKLIQKLNINDWVNQGKSYLQENETCPFCQKNTITEDFKKQLDSFFDGEFINDIKSIKNLKGEYLLLIANLVNELNQLETNQKNDKNNKLELEKFSSYLKTLISQITANKELLNNKVKEPSRSVELINLEEQFGLISNLIDNANSEITQNNLIVSNYNTERETLIKQVWKYCCNEFNTQITKFNTDNAGIEKGISALKSQIQEKLNSYKTLDAEIKNLSKNVTSIQPTIDEINRLLINYGFINFKIVPATEDGFYQIQREDGTIAEKTLSEGEVTFITFLYYLQLTKGGRNEESVNEERILVIDDPISSLDSNILFIISTLVKEIAKKIKTDEGNIKQLILLTHNVYFHKEVSYEGLNRKGEKPSYWILRKNNNQSIIHSYGTQNPIQSSYELLWREIKEWEHNSGITIQNTMRRILENFYSILGNKRDDFLINKFESREEKDICRSLLSWTNEGSHTLPDDLYIEAPDDTIMKYIEVFKKIFYYTENKGHYLMMMGIEDEE
ncbi:AAA family ATPase [Tenacibaculum piscium]|uniref:AAA family ATPase n=1 Tax=Tenacibaculum piscium TaxID=1458515 RepID=UPI00187B4EDE|nr:AAA family ATPase [Tenacibaculum piscium]MBE7686575.1 AAA family ATPase [Tenacibaculum piscium]